MHHVKRIFIALLDTSPWLLPTIGSLVVAWGQGNSWFIALGIAIVLTAAVPVWNTSIRRQAAETTDLLYDARERMVSEYAASLIREAATLEEAPRPLRLDEARSKVPELIRRVSENVYGDRDDLRFVLYRVGENGDALLVVDQWGRQGRARAFTKDEARTQLALDRLNDVADHYLCMDTLELPLEHDLAGRDYRSYISAPIRSANSALGMLTVDAKDVNALSARDGEIMEVVAAMVAFYWAAAQRGKKFVGRRKPPERH